MAHQNKHLRKTLFFIMKHSTGEVKPLYGGKEETMKRKFLALVICVAMMLTLVPQAIFAVEKDADSTVSTEVAAPLVNEDGYGSAIEPKSSRWYPQIVVEKEDEPFTKYSADKKRKVKGTYTLKALYHVYRDGSGKKIHQHDTYYYTWTGYQKKGDAWVKVPGYIDVKETIRDRGPVAFLFSFLI